MPSDCVRYKDSGYFSPLIIDYLNQEPKLKKFYNRFPALGTFIDQIEEKRRNYSEPNRTLLVKILQEQYRDITASEATKANIASLAHDNTFTITTGHQLNIFTGPLYFLYKIISAINLCKQLKDEHAGFNFVPVFWMATEDHDFDEINHFNFKGRKFSWNRDKAGPTGRLPTDGMQDVFSRFERELGPGVNAARLRSLFEKSYLQHDTLADATRFLANEIFGEYGVVILDADEQELKTAFIPQMENELFINNAFEKVSETIEQLSSYGIQVNPREINLFYMEDGYRDRIIKQEDTFYVNNTGIKFTETEIRNELRANPQKFSPNVIMRPLYQEVLLPNLCYIGGGAEIAYWLELKSFFEAENVTFPILLLRNSAVIATEKQARKLDRMELQWKDIFLPKNELHNRQTEKISAIPIDFSEQRKVINEQFEALLQIAEKTDKSFSGAVLAQQTKQLKGLDKLEKRLLKAQKRRYSDELERVNSLQEQLFPSGTLQERNANFSEFYLHNGEKLVPKLIEKLDPLSDEFSILVV